jgi:flagellar basal-body rod protein FlgF
MDSLTIAAAGGLRARIETLDMLANNLANATTAGFKLDREFYGVFRGEANGDASASTLPVIERPWIDFSQGLLQETGNPLNAALSGKGLFSVNGPSGPLYTRNGSFRLNSEGTLVTAEGYPARAVGGATIRSQNSGPIEIDRSGAVLEGGQLLGQLEIVECSDPSKLTKQGASYFRTSDSSVLSQAKDIDVQQGKLEASNVSSAESAARLVGVMRHFEMLQKAVTLAGDMNRKAVEEIAKIGA